MADRFLNLLLARVRFVVANLPVLQLVAFLLVVAATVIHIVVLPGRENAIEEAERRMATVRQAFPDLAVEDISLRRENIGSTEVEAQLRFILFGRRSGA